MKGRDIYKVRADTTEQVDAIQELVFSVTTKAGAVFASAALVAIAVGSRSSAEETLLSTIIAGISVAGSLMLCLQSKYALHVWSALLACMGIAQAIVSDHGRHGIVYWSGRITLSVTLIWFAYLLFRLGTRIAHARKE